MESTRFTQPVVVPLPRILWWLNLAQRNGAGALKAPAAALLIGLGAIVVLSSCMGGGAQPKSVAAQPKSGNASGVIQGSRIKSYSSIRQLAADSNAVVVAVATSVNSPANVQGTPYTITTVEVRSTLRGSVSGSTIKIRQLGNQTIQTSDEIDPLLVSGTTYVLFLDVFSFGPGQNTDQYVIVGGSAGVYILQGQAAHHVRGPDQVPQSISLGDLQSEVVG
jgi:hypothetical protein